MKDQIFVCLILAAVLLLAGCSKDEPIKDPTPPVISDVKIINNGDDFVTVGFALSNPDGAVLDEVGVLYGDLTAEVNNPVVGLTNVTDVNKTIEVKVSQLNDDTSYNFIPYVKYRDTEVQSPGPIFGNTTSKKWTLLSEFPGNGRAGAVSFAIGYKIYAGLGSDVYGIHQQDNNYKDFWEYNTKSDTWTQLEDFPGGARSLSFAFALDGKGYIGSGRDKNTPGDYGKIDFWEFDPVLGSWTQKNDLPSPGDPQMSGLLYTVADAANGIAYYGTGVFVAHVFPVNKMYRYDRISDEWTAVPDYPEEGQGFVSFMVGNRLFVGGGNLGAGYQRKPYPKFHRLNFLGTDWEEVASLPDNTLNFFIDGIGSKGFSIGDFGYIITPFDGLYKFDVANNLWNNESTYTKLIEQNPVYSLVGAVVENKAYLGLGLERSPDGQSLIGSKKWAVFDPSK